jgi:hypothetical protein
MTKGSALVLRIYFGLVSAVTLFTLMFGTIDFLSTGLKTYVFPAADVPPYGIVNCDSLDAKYQYGTEYVPGKLSTDPATSRELTSEETKARCEAANETAMENYRTQKAQDAVRNLALIIVSLPLFVLHFRIVYRDWKGEKSS